MTLEKDKILFAIEDIQDQVEALQKQVRDVQLPDFEQLNSIEGPFQLKVFARKNVGYKSLYRCAEANNCLFFDENKIQIVKIPQDFVVETDGILWSIRRIDHADDDSESSESVF